MTDKKSSESRRKLLKSIAAGSGAVIAGKSLPEKWVKPIVDSVVLPTHAQATGDAPRTITFTNCSISNAQYETPTIVSLDIAYTASSNYGADLTQITTVDAIFTFQTSGTNQTWSVTTTTDALGNGTTLTPQWMPAPIGQTSVAMTITDIDSPVFDGVTIVSCTTDPASITP